MRIAAVMVGLAGIVAALAWVARVSTDAPAADMPQPAAERGHATWQRVPPAASAHAPTSTAVGGGGGAADAPQPGAAPALQTGAAGAFQHGTDLWALAQRAAQSGDRAQVIEAHTAVVECL